MSERERWIVYPLLFLALGASLRDKIIKTTESQRIKCQGLWVYDDESNKPLLVLGAKQFPEFPSGTPNLLQVDKVIAGEVLSQGGILASTIEGNVIKGNAIQSKTLQTNRLLGPRLKRSDGQLVFPLWNWWSAMGIDPTKLMRPDRKKPPGEAAPPVEERPVGERAAPPPSPPSRSTGAAQ